VQGVYDAVRDVYYFTDTNKIQVFSRTKGAWLSPIAIPAPPGTTQRLWGLSLSSDSTKLAIADAQAAVVYLLNPADPTSVRTFPVIPPQSAQGILVLPSGVAISDSGLAYVVAEVKGGTGFHNYFILNTNTGEITDLGIDGPGLGASDINLRLAISADNSRVFFNNDGYVFSIDTTTFDITSARIDSICCYGNYELTLAPNQIQLEASSYLYDSNLNAASTLVLNDREVLDVSYVYGTKFSPDGSLLFQPGTQGLDIYDGRLGTLRARVAFPLALSTNYDALVSNGRDNILVAITGTTGNGIAIADFSSMQEPPPLPYTLDAARSDDIKTQRHFRTPSKDTHPSTKPPAARPRAIPHISNPLLLQK
jgi:hypothetical protein